MSSTREIILQHIAEIGKVNPKLAARLTELSVAIAKFETVFDKYESRYLELNTRDINLVTADPIIRDFNQEARDTAYDLFTSPAHVYDTIKFVSFLYKSARVEVLRDNPELGLKIGLSGAKVSLSDFFDEVLQHFVWNPIALEELPPSEHVTDGRDLFVGNADGGEVRLLKGDDLFLPENTNEAYDVNGGIGNDMIVGGTSGQDSLKGDEGNDTIIASHGAFAIRGGDENDWLQTEALVEIDMAGDKGSDTIVGSSYSDDLFGTDIPLNRDTIKSAPASDINYLIGRGGGDVVNGGIGRDYLIGDNFADSRGEMQNTLFADFIDSVGSKIESSGNAGNDIMIGYAGDDVMAGGGGDDILWGDDSETQPLGLEGGRDILFGDAGLDQLHGGDGIDKLFGGAGSDVLRGGDDIDLLSGGGAPAGGIDLLYGGGDADIFEFNNKSILMDASAEDFIAFAGGTKQITGGVQQFWMEGGWAYYSPFSAILSAGGGMGLLSDLLYAASVLTDLRTGAHFRFGLTTSDQLLMQIGRGRAGVMVLNNYDLDLEEAKATGNVVAYQVDYREGKSATLAEIKEFLNLALGAGSGLSAGADPLMIDLDGDGLELSRERSSKAYFDFDGDNFAEHTAWAKKDDGFLARDVNANGKIDGLGELFGNATTSGLNALKLLDANGDNKISSADSAFGSLRIWQDANANGVSETGELKTLSTAGIREISLTSLTPTDNSIRGNSITAEATYTRADGTSARVYDVLLEHGQLDTKYLGNSNVSPAAASLPSLKGYGNLPNLQIAMTGDATLLNLVTGFKNLANTSSWTVLQNSADDILFRWAGVQGVAKTAIGTAGLDRQKLAFLEKYHGYQLMTRDGSGNPVGGNAAQVLQLWNDTLNDATVRLAVQGPLKSLMPGAAFDTFQDSFLASTATALADGISGALTQLSATAATALSQWNNSWSKIIDGYADAMMRSNSVQVRDDFMVQSLVKAMDGKTLPLTLQQLADGLGMASVVKIGTTGNDTLARGAATGLQVFVGDRGNDTMTGGAGQDVYVFGRTFGKDVITDTDVPETGDRIRLSVHNPSEVTIKRVGDDLVITVTATGDSITVKGQYTKPRYDLAGLPITPDKAIEEIQFADGTVMEAIDITAAIGLGTNGNDTINGTGYADEIEGLKGNDLLSGGDNGDGYYYTLGDGNDTIDDAMTQPTANAPDTLYLLGAITEDDLRFTREGKSDDLTISLASGAGSITVKNQFDYSSTGFDTKFALNDRIEVFVLEQGGILDWLQIQDKVIQTYTTDGNDTTYGFGTSDTLYASEGNDFLVGIDGGDTYQFVAGGGQDTVHDQSQYPETFIAGLVGYSWGADDAVKFGAGIKREDVTFTRPTSADDLLITLTTTGDTMLIKDQFDGTKLDLFNLLGVAWFDRVEKFIFADGTILTWADVLEEVLTGSPGNDSIYGTYGNETLDGGAGNDFLAGEDENDTYIFGRGYGQDVIQDSRTNILSSDEDVLIFKSGIAVSDVVFSRDTTKPFDLLLSIKGTTDTLRIVDHYDVAYTGVFNEQHFNRMEKFIWADGTVKTASQITAEMMAVFKRPASEFVLGTTEQDLMDSAGGNDTMDGGNAADTYVFGTGYGHDVLRDGVSNVLAEEGDTVRFLAPITPANLKLSRVGEEMQDLLITFTNSADSLTIRNQFTYFTIGSNHYQIDSFAFADGTIWTPDTVRANYLASRQTSGNDVVIGFQYDETLTGGLGSDHLLGGDGADTYVFSKGFGKDIIQDNIRWVTKEYNQDKIQFDATILPANTRLLRYGNELDLTISFTDSTDRITVLNNFNQFGYYDIDAIHFSGGVVWTEAFIKQNIIAQNSTTGADIIYGFAEGESINAQSGNDVIFGYKGNDTIIGGTGNDVMDGGEGDDVFLISQNQGWDIIDDYYGKADVLSFGPGITWDNTVFYRMDDNLMLKLVGGGTVLVEDGFSTYYGVDSFRFADGVVKSLQDVVHVFLLRRPLQGLRVTILWWERLPIITWTAEMVTIYSVLLLVAAWMWWMLVLARIPLNLAAASPGQIYNSSDNIMISISRFPMAARCSLKAFSVVGV